MAIRQRGSAWQADVTVKGTRHRETFNTEAEAKSWEHRLKAAVLSGEHLATSKGSANKTKPEKERPRGRDGSSSDTFWVWAERTRDRFWAGISSEVTAMQNAKLMAGYFQDCPIQRIHVDALDGLVAHLQSCRNSNATINRKLAVVSRVLRFAHDRGALAKVPKIERKREAAGRIRWLTEAEERAILALLEQSGKSDHADVIRVLLDTGMRPKEVYRMKPQDVSLRDGSVSIWENKTDHPRTVFMTKRVRAIVERRIGVATTPNATLFPYDNSWMRHAWDRLKSHLNLDHDPHFVPYIGRHTCASRLIQRGVRLEIVQRQLGHKGLQMTMRYAHLSPTNMRDAIQVLETPE